MDIQILDIYCSYRYLDFGYPGFSDMNMDNKITDLLDTDTHIHIHNRATPDKLFFSFFLLKHELYTYIYNSKEALFIQIA